MTIPLFQNGREEEYLFKLISLIKSLLTLIVTYLFNTLFFGSILFGETPKAPAIFKESSNWEIEKNSLNILVELLEEEKQKIDEKLQSFEKENSAGEEERIKLSDV
jgi:hypothetical protein